jgi:large repetitive protein
MTKRLIKTKKDHKRMRAVLTENTQAAPAMTPAAGALAAGVINVAHAGVTFAFTNPVGAAHYSLAAGALPVGMTLDTETGILSGTPTVVAANSFSIRGTDDFGNTKVNAYTLNVTAS